MIRVTHGPGSVLLGTIALPWRSRLPASAPRHDTDPNDRATSARAANGRTSEFSAESSQCHTRKAARYTSARTHRSSCAAPATRW